MRSTPRWSGGARPTAARMALANQVQALGLDRTKLAAALDGETARSRRLEDANREVAERLDAAIASIQSVLDCRTCDLRMGTGFRTRSCETRNP